MNKQPWKLSPSDFAFLWEDCKRCFYLKVVNNFRQPSPPMPKIFTVISAEMTKYYIGKRISRSLPALLPGVVEHGETWVKSRPITVPNHSSKIFVLGRLDAVIRFNDGTYGVVDFKTSETKDGHIPLYSRQLHAYAYALENPEPGYLALKPISKLGLLVFEPNAFTGKSRGKASLLGKLGWIEIPRDDGAFLSFLDGVLDVLDRSSPPKGTTSCEWCRYRKASRRMRL